MNILTPEKLAYIIPFISKHNSVSVYAGFLNSTMDEFFINTPKRQAAFIAQVAHESGSLVYNREIASGEAYDTGELAKRLGNTPEKDGDGEKYRGRGWMMITGHDNYLYCGEALGLDLINYPELLEETPNASRSSGWFWKTRNLNRFADVDQFGAMTKAINGGFNGIDDRIQFWLRAREVLL